jgi:hypothetical protein
MLITIGDFVFCVRVSRLHPANIHDTTNYNQRTGDFYYNLDDIANRLRVRVTQPSFEKREFLTFNPFSIASDAFGDRPQPGQDILHHNRRRGVGLPCATAFSRNLWRVRRYDLRRKT